MQAIRVTPASGDDTPSPHTGETPTDYSHATLAGCVARADTPRATSPPRPFSLPTRARKPTRDVRVFAAPRTPATQLTVRRAASRSASLRRYAMDLRGGDPESTRSACVKLRDLAVAAEGPGAPFTATARGQQLLRLIHIVVQNVGLEDKVGALTALRLLKADDTLLQRLLKEGILPPLLAIIARDAADADGDWDDGSVVAGAGAAHLRLVRAETAAAAARAVEAFSSSGDSLTTLLRGGAVEALSDRLCRARGELADTPPARVVGENAENANGAASALGKARARRRRRRATGAGAYFREQPRVGAGSRPVREPFR